MNQSVKEYISEGEIQKKVKEIAREMSERLKDENPLFIGVLKGGFIFLSDLVRNLDFPLEIDFIQASSYRDATVSSGEVELSGAIKALKGRTVVLVEDIIDTGKTLERVTRHLKENGAKEVITVALLDKPDRRVVEFSPDYTGFTIEDKYVVGYGMDIADRERNLPYIGVMEENE